MRSIGTRLLAMLTLVAMVGAPTVALSQSSPFPLSPTVTMQNAVQATGNGTQMSTAQLGAITLQVTGTLTSLTVAFEASNDGTNFVALTCYTLDSSTSATSTTSTGIWRCNTNGISAVRARVSTYSSGTVTVIGQGTSNAANIRDTITPSGAITGQLRGTQTTAPTCAVLTAGGTLATTSCVIDGGTDSFIRGHVASGLALVGAASTSPVVRVTFNTAYAATPACTAAKDTKYGYYIYAVTPTTTTVDVKIDAQAGWVTPAATTPIWVAQDLFSVICAGVQ